MDPIDTPSTAVPVPTRPTPPAALRRGGFVGFVALVAVAALAVAVWSLTSASSTPAGSISVTGSATAVGAPDTASFTLGFQTTNTKATTALAFSNLRVSQIEQALLKNGVTKADMQTSGLDIYANSSYNGSVTSFTVDDTLTVTMHDLSKVGQALEAGAKAARKGVELDGVTFSISNSSKLLADARESATRQARSEASGIAAAAGASLGGVEKITIAQNQPVQPFTPVPYDEFSANAGHAVPVESGTQTLTVTATVVFALTN